MEIGILHCWKTWAVFWPRQSPGTSLAAVGTSVADACGVHSPAFPPTGQQEANPLQESGRLIFVIAKIHWDSLRKPCSSCLPLKWYLSFASSQGPVAKEMLIWAWIRCLQCTVMLLVMPCWENCLHLVLLCCTMEGELNTQAAPVLSLTRALPSIYCPCRGIVWACLQLTTTHSTKKKRHSK